MRMKLETAIRTGCALLFIALLVVLVGSLAGCNHDDEYEECVNENFNSQRKISNQIQLPVDKFGVLVHEHCSQFPKSAERVHVSD